MPSSIFFRRSSGRKNHEILTQTRFVIRNRDGGLRRAQPAMSGSLVSRIHARQFKGNHVGAQQSHDPTDGTNETGTTLAGPIHRLRERDLEDCSRKRFRQDIDHPTPFDFPQVGVILAFARGFDGQLLRPYAEFAREPFYRLGVGGARRTHHTLLGIGEPIGQAFGAQDQSSRRGIQPHICRGNADPRKQRAEAIESAWNHPVRNFLGADL